MFKKYIKYMGAMCALIMMMVMSACSALPANRQDMNDMTNRLVSAMEANKPRPTIRPPVAPPIVVESDEYERILEETDEPATTLPDGTVVPGTNKKRLWFKGSLDRAMLDKELRELQPDTTRHPAPPAGQVILVQDADGNWRQLPRPSSARYNTGGGMPTGSPRLRRSK